MAQRFDCVAWALIPSLKCLEIVTSSKLDTLSTVRNKFLYPSSVTSWLIEKERSLSFWKSPWLLPWPFLLHYHHPKSKWAVRKAGLGHEGIASQVVQVLLLYSCMDVRVGLWRRLSAEQLMLLNCGVGEDSWESLGLQGDPTSSSWRRSALGFIWKEWC